MYIAMGKDRYFALSLWYTPQKKCIKQGARNGVRTFMLIILPCIVLGAYHFFQFVSNDFSSSSLTLPTFNVYLSLNSFVQLYKQPSHCEAIVTHKLVMPWYRWRVIIR